MSAPLINVNAPDDGAVAAMRKVLEAHGVFIVQAPSYDQRHGFQFPEIVRGFNEAIVLTDIMQAGINATVKPYV